MTVMLSPGGGHLCPDDRLCRECYWEQVNLYQDLVRDERPPLREWDAGTVAPVDARPGELALHLLLHGSVHVEVPVG